MDCPRVAGGRWPGPGPLPIPGFDPTINGPRRHPSVVCGIKGHAEDLRGRAFHHLLPLKVPEAGLQVGGHPGLMGNCGVPVQQVVHVSLKGDPGAFRIVIAGLPGRLERSQRTHQNLVSFDFNTVLFADMLLLRHGARHQQDQAENTAQQPRHAAAAAETRQKKNTGAKLCGGGGGGRTQVNALHMECTPFPFIH